MRHLLPRWVGLTLVVALMVTAFIRLGVWQWHRLEQRRATNATVLANEAKPAVGFETVYDHPISDADQWQRVIARGNFDGSKQIQARYRSNDGAQGYEVITPLRTDGGTTVLVDRGFAAVRNGKYPDAVPAPPDGAVTVVGYVKRDERGRAKALQPVDGKVRLINSVAIGADMGEPLANGYISAISIEPAQDGELTPVGLPTLSEGPHFWYSMQWYMFAGLALIGMGVFIRRDLRTLGSDVDPDQDDDSDDIDAASDEGDDHGSGADGQSLRGDGRELGVGPRHS